MIIKKAISVNRYPYTDPKTNKIVYPGPISLDELDVTFVENDKARTIFAKIKDFPASVLLYGPTTYSKLEENQKTEDALTEKLLHLMGEDPSQFLQKIIPKTLESNPNGPGTILSGMLSSLGIKSSANCSCKRRAIAMNENGPEWCENNKEQILSWLEEEAKRRKLPFVKIVAQALVNRAINKSKRLLAKENA